MDVLFAPIFVRTLRSFPEGLQEEVIEKIELFRDPSKHKALKVHKLTGRLKDRYAFSVNYKIRIIFSYLSIKPRSAILLAVGDHDVYDR